jgi:hypothetical protein
MRYQHQRKVRYNNKKGFNEDIPLIINKDFHNQYKRKMAVNNTGVHTIYDTPKLSKEEFHKQN